MTAEILRHKTEMKSLKFQKLCLASLLTFLSILIFTPAVRGGLLPVKIYTSADGLGSSFVDYLFRDSRGFMWFCTRDGLSRFDGSRFITYQIGDGNAPPGIESIYQTRDGSYWLSTTGGSYRFDLNEISKPNADKPQINAEFITGGRGHFFEDSMGNVFLTSGRLSRVVKQAGKYALEPEVLNIPVKSNMTLLVYEIDETSDGSLWMNSNAGIIRRLPDSRLIFYPIETGMGSGSASLKADKNGRIWISIANRIFVIKPESPAAFENVGEVIIKSLEATTIFTLKPKENFSLPQTGGEIFEFTNDKIDNFVESSYAKRIFQTSDGDVWITAEDKLMQFSNGVFYLHSRAEGLPSVMTRMAEDSAGNLWIGGHAGLARLDRNGLVTYRISDSAGSARFFAINEDEDGAIYVAGRDFDLYRIDNEKFETVKPLIEPNSQYLWTSRFGFRASNGDWWMLTNKKLYQFSGIDKFSELDQRKPTATFSTAEGLKANSIFQIYEDADKSIWISTRGTVNEAISLARLKKDENKFYTFTQNDGLPEGKAASSFANDNFGNLWFGFYEGGIARFDGERFEFFGKEFGVPIGVITDLLVDSKERLWIASALNGLLRIDDTSAKTPTFVNFNTVNGLTSNNVRTITADQFGRIYAGTASGVDRLSPDTGKVKHYSVNDGLAADFVVDSHRDKNGNIWFATNDGLSKLVPKPDETASAPQVFIGGLQIAGLEQPISHLGDKEIIKGDLTHTENNFQISFFGLDFRAGETLRYQYKLEGADADWSPPTELRTVTFANLQPASYRFLVRAVNSDGTVSENPAVISFKILPPIYLRWWFILLTALLLTAIIVLLYRYRTARLREINAALTDAKAAEENLRKSREERLAELEQVRSRIATDLHDDIGASLTQIAVLSEVAQAQSKNNGASESLTKISNVSNELVGTMSDIVWSINPTKDHLSDLTQRMRRFASDVLSAKGIAFQFHSTEADKEKIINTNVRREVFLIFKESINNIAKHSGAKKVSIELNVRLNDLILEIIDDGKGFEIEKSFENSLSSIALGGNGISSMEKRALEMDGSLEITSGLGKGTTVRLNLPMEHFTEI